MRKCEHKKEPTAPFYVIQFEWKELISFELYEIISSYRNRQSISFCSVEDRR
ncbi:hypothetical protein LEP1GSC062_1089 [Leptospira alexanderi serovar Manhao 3 str. L 60]|uniref:Uncharacterized protein n=1 Tax=Leptospira alexanderi serovar Manhao 3 str. L 60 TaxID=1049759 RepID=V6HY50_9LEPT|nr:hypothetical protein LEP1GSC062_1089 [Leptospira alexanderi serovar Manhao 3 str. L 60]